MILLDTDVIIEILRQSPPTLLWLESLENGEILLPGFVVMELIQGCESKNEQQALETELNKYHIIWPLPDTCKKALDVFARYHLSNSIGIIDCLIGQTAIEYGLPLYTYNQKHYAIIPDLKAIEPC